MEQGQQLWNELSAFIDANAGPLVKPGHRVKFNWPPPLVSYEYRIPAEDFVLSGSFEVEGETFTAKLAETPQGVFAKCETLWLEVKGESIEDALLELSEASLPLLNRQWAIARTLGLKERYAQRIRDLDAISHLKLLFCSDRDIAYTSNTIIEQQAAAGDYSYSLIQILRDRRHPNQRIAQWCVLDLFEDLRAFCKTDELMNLAIEAIEDFIFNSTDDYARCTFKAGVVVGGHMPSVVGGPVLTRCLLSPSKYARRSAIHGLFHVVEWEPTLRNKIVGELEAYAESELEADLRRFAVGIARDLRNEANDHLPEPVFQEELASH